MISKELIKGLKECIKSNIQQRDYYKWKTFYKNKIEKFHNIHNGEDCFIIGNGPSLNDMNLFLLNDYFTFGLNKIHLIFDEVDLNLNYHVSVNDLVLEQISEELKSKVYNCPSFISYTASEHISDELSHVIKLYTKGRWSFYKDLTNRVSEGFTVTYVAMQIAYYMGFKRVFLIGVDHNFVQKGNPNEKQNMDEEDVNHFHPDYFKGNSWNLADLEGSEASYALARHQFHTDNRQILDATVDGQLDIFPKISFDKALKIAGTRS